MNPITSAFQKAIQDSGTPAALISIVSDIPFTPEQTNQLGVDFFHTIRGRAIAFGSGLKLANPALKIVSVVGDMMTLGGNHFVHAARRNIELVVVCINNFVYRKVAGQEAPGSHQAFSPYSAFEEPFNIPHLGNSCGAVYTARWTALHTEELAASISEALNKRGLSLIEILAPGPDYYTGIDNVQSELTRFYHQNSVLKNGEDPRSVGIGPDNKIVVGRFTDRERPTFIDVYNIQLGKVLGDKFEPYGKTESNR